MKHTGPKHAGWNPHNREKHRNEAAPEALLELARQHPTDRAVCIAGMCVWCVRDQRRWPVMTDEADAIRHCPDKRCPLHTLRAYQKDVPPRSARHLEIPEPTWEREPEGDTDR